MGVRSALATSTPSFKKLARVVQRELGHRDMQGTPRIPAQRCADRPERKASAVNALSALVAESVCRACSRRGDRPVREIFQVTTHDLGHNRMT